MSSMILERFSKEIREKYIWQFIYDEIINWGLCGITEYEYTGNSNSLEGVKSILDQCGLEIDSRVLEMDLMGGFDVLLYSKEERTPFEIELMNHISKKTSTDVEIRREIKRVEDMCDSQVSILETRCKIQCEEYKDRINTYKCVVGMLVGVVCSLIYMLVR